MCWGAMQLHAAQALLQRVSTSLQPTQCASKSLMGPHLGRQPAQTQPLLVSL